jgi:hypothetical protein
MRSQFVRRGLGLFVGYTILSLLLWRSVVPHLATHALYGGLFDPSAFIWWLKWTPYALTHGMSPLHSSYLDAPDGVSAMWNSSVLALGVLFAPVTALFGPIVSYNVACILGPPLSAWTAWLWLRRHAHDASAAVGGLVFGFSPFVIAHSNGGHLNFTWLFLLPVILMLVEDLLWRAERPLWPQAPLLGLAVTAQLFIGSEALFICSLGCVTAALVIGAFDLRAARERLRVLAPAAAVAVAVAVVLCAPALLEQFHGSRVIHEPVFQLGRFGGRPPMLVSASPTLAFHTGHGPSGNLAVFENGLYIGWPLIVLLGVVVAFLIRRRRGVVIAAAAVVIAAAFQMHGSRWHFAGLSVPAPFRVLQNHVHLLRDILPGRFAIIMWFAIAWLLAVGLDAAISRVHEMKAHPAWAALPVVVVAACLVPLLPGHIHTRELAITPRLFTTSLRNTIPSGATVMVAPLATSANAAAEIWQVRAGMRFRQLGGYMQHAVGPRGEPSLHPATPMLAKLFAIDSSTRGPYKVKTTPALLDGARAELRAAHTSMFIVGHSIGEAILLARAELLLGRPPDQRTGGVAIWRLSG